MMAIVTARQARFVVSWNAKVAAPLSPAAVRVRSAAPAWTPVPPELLLENRPSSSEGTLITRSPSPTA